MTKAAYRSPRREEPFRIHVYPERDGVRVVPVGELDVATARGLEETLHELHEVGFARIVIDLRELTFLGSAGLRLLIVEHDLAGRDGHELALIDGPPVVRRVIELCGLHHQLCFVSGRATSPRSLRVRRGRVGSRSASARRGP